jgi:ribonuclease P protein subunit POP4
VFFYMLGGRVCGREEKESEVEKKQEKKKRPLVFELHGHQFESRAPDRANKKFKMHIDPDL